MGKTKQLNSSNKQHELMSIALTFTVTWLGLFWRLLSKNLLKAIEKPIVFFEYSSLSSFSSTDSLASGVHCPKANKPIYGLAS